MQYEWKCKECGEIVVVRRSVDDRDYGPTLEGGEVTCEHGESSYRRIISNTSTPFEHLRDRGVLERTHWHPSNNNW